jgi:hypothetical protein
MASPGKAAVFGSEEASGVGSLFGVEMKERKVATAPGLAPRLQAEVTGKLQEL